MCAAKWTKKRDVYGYLLSRITYRHCNCVGIETAHPRVLRLVFDRRFECCLEPLLRSRDETQTCAIQKRHHIKLLCNNGASIRILLCFVTSVCYNNRVRAFVRLFFRSTSTYLTMFFISSFTRALSNCQALLRPTTNQIHVLISIFA